MIVVATADFEVYHGIVQALRDRSVEFTTVDADGPLPAWASLVIVGPGETIETPADVPVVTASPETPRRAVEDALTRLRGGDGRTIVGIDPGEKPGIAVLVDDVVVAAFQVPATEAPEVVAREIEDAVDPLVRVGDGARLVGTRIIDDIDAPVELVDETGTTPYLGSGARGMGDVLAATNIARLDGELVESRDIEPTDGEIQRIKERSREVSETNRAIDETLARRVAIGDLSIEEALTEHRERE